MIPRSVLRPPALLCFPLVLAACSDAAPIEGCPPGSISSGGACRPTCARTEECLATETCDLAIGACVPRSDGGPSKPDAGPAGDGGRPPDGGVGQDADQPGDALVLPDVAPAGDGGFTLTAEPSALDFGQVPMGCIPPAQEVTLRNDGAGEVQLDRAQLIPFAGELTITQDPLPVRLQPRTSVRLALGYAPIDLGFDTTTLTISSAQSAVLLEVPVRGEGIDRRVHEDHQQSFDQADILFVVDDSCSMGPVQQTLSDRIPILIQYLADHRIDWQIGVTTTDPTPPDRAGGALTGQPAILTPASVQRLADRLRPGTNGNAVERGLGAAHAAVNEPLINVPPNAGFLRPNASLAVIIVSDDNDYSSATVQEYVAGIEGAKGVGYAANIAINAIVGLSLSSCTQVQLPGLRYVDAVNASGGQLIDLCAQDWGPALTTLPPSTVPLLTQIKLGATPDPTTIEVRVGGAPWVRWSYDAAENAVDFGQNAPPYGADIAIDYVSACP